MRHVKQAGLENWFEIEPLYEARPGYCWSIFLQAMRKAASKRQNGNILKNLSSKVDIIYGCMADRDVWESQIETCMCCTLYFVYVLEICTTRETCKIALRFDLKIINKEDWNFTARWVLCDFRCIPDHPPFDLPPKIDWDPPGGNKNSPRRCRHPGSTWRHADGASTNAQNPQHLGMRKC